VVGPVVVLAVVVALAIVLLRRGRDEVVFHSRPARWLVRGALALIGLEAAFWLFMGVGEMASGDFSGVSHLAPAAILIALMLLAWRRPFEAGILLVAVSVVSALYFSRIMREGLRFDLATLLVAGLPLICGVLLLAAKAAPRLSH